MGAPLCLCRKPRAFSIFALLLLVFPGTLRADWDISAQSWFQEFQRTPVRFHRPFESTLWGGIQVLRIWRHRVHYRKWFLPAPSQFSKRRFLVPVVLQSDKRGRIRKAPLLIHLPGIFSDRSGPTVRSALRHFPKMGYHIAVISSPWSKDYLDSEPRFAPGDLEIEVSVIRELISHLQIRIGTDHIDGIELMGESYGALLAAATFAQEHKDGLTRLSRPVTLFSPPLDFLKSRENLDRLIDEEQHTYFSHCRRPIRILRNAGRVLRARGEEELTSFEVKCSKAAFSWGVFHHGLIEAAERLDRIHHGGQVPSRFRLLAFRNWNRQYRFMDFLQTYHPDLIREPSLQKKVRLSYWLEQIPPDCLHQLRILSTLDDPLNDALDWEPLLQDPTLENVLLLLPWGGHMGYYGLPEFKRFKDRVFALPVRTTPAFFREHYDQSFLQW